MSKLIACSLGALLLAGNVSAALAQSIPQGMPQNLQQLQSGQWGQQNGQNAQFNQNGQNGQFNQQGQNGQNGQNQQASNGSKRQRQQQQKLTKEQKLIQQYVPQQYQGYLPAGVTGAAGGGGMSQ